LVFFVSAAAFVWSFPCPAVEFTVPTGGGKKPSASKFGSDTDDVIVRDQRGESADDIISAKLKQSSRERKEKRDFKSQAAAPEKQPAAAVPGAPPQKEPEVKQEDNFMENKELSFSQQEEHANKKAIAMEAKEFPSRMDRWKRKRLNNGGEPSAPPSKSSKNTRADDDGGDD
jgi:hypothetical protein